MVAIVDWWTGALPFLAFATVGALILSRRPHNAIGWLCWTMGAVVSFGSVGFEAATRMAGDPVSRPVALVLLVGSATFLVSLLGLLPLLVLVFPTGRLPSRRWRPAVWVFAGGLVLYLGLYVLQPGPIGDGLPANPLGVGWAERLLERVGPVLGLLFMLFVVLVLVSLALRFRRARDDERQQLKWFTFAAALTAVLPPALGGLAERASAPLVGAVFFTLVTVMLPAAIGVAILKYRLYDIDRLINRTLVYGLLTALLAGVYAGAVLVLGQLFGGSEGIRLAGRWPARPWPWRRCSSRPAAASKRSWIGASTAASTMRPRPSRPSAPGCETRSTWTPSRPSCWR